MVHLCIFFIIMEAFSVNKLPIPISHTRMNKFCSLTASFRRYRLQGVVSCYILALEGNTILNSMILSSMTMDLITPSGYTNIHNTSTMAPKWIVQSQQTRASTPVLRFLLGSVKRNNHHKKSKEYWMMISLDCRQFVLYFVFLCNLIRTTSNNKYR